MNHFLEEQLLLSTGNGYLFPTEEGAEDVNTTPEDAYRCSILGSLPKETFVIHLQRSIFDLKLMTNTKIDDKIKFPAKISAKQIQELCCNKRSPPTPMNEDLFLRGVLNHDSEAGYSAYVAAKGAIASLTRQWATEWAKHGITVNAISPTFVDTPQVATLLGDPAFKAGIINRIPLRRVGDTDDLIGPCLLFCSAAGAFVTGQILMIDGGLTATQ